MYYSKNYPKNRNQTITVPRNYSGNTFRVIDETERTYPRDTEEDKDRVSGTDRHFSDKDHPHSFKNRRDSIETEKHPCTSPPLSSLLPKAMSNKDTAIAGLLSNVSVEDVLLLGIMLVIYTNDPSDPTLLLLLILLLAK